jgi:hypothetical protein
VSPSLTLTPEVELVLGKALIGLQVGGGVFLQRQRYQVEGVKLLETHSVWGYVGVTLGFSL